MLVSLETDAPTHSSQFIAESYILVRHVKTGEWKCTRMPHSVSAAKEILKTSFNPDCGEELYGVYKSWWEAHCVANDIQDKESLG